MVSRQVVKIEEEFIILRTKACEVMNGEFIRPGSVRVAAVLLDAANDVRVVCGLGVV